MRLLPTICILCAYIPLTFSSPAEVKKQPFYGQSLGITHNFSKQTLSIYIDQSKILKIIPRLQKAKLVESNLSYTEASFYETQLSAMISLLYITKIIQDLYSSNPKNDQIHVVSYLLSPDIYGNNSKTFCYSFKFNRQLYQKINWKNFQPNNLVNIALDFNVSYECKVIEESSLLSI